MKSILFTGTVESPERKQRLSRTESLFHVLGQILTVLPYFFNVEKKKILKNISVATTSQDNPVEIRVREWDRAAL